MSYKSQTHYTPAELLELEALDQSNDATHAEEQAKNGPFYPERGITAETLLEYAKTCREKAARLSRERA